ncbi:CyP450 monooxygenase [Artomyces pyxidatus]|uniref:CyP450 monooxygenase n=1 Tax=Artomyces pyxidatus TaxID=48021 RepID=A0ACB8T1L8_9AGAM|nr:CyP450 monooxygenase [Artomyces pyxidatus]
MTYSFNTLDLKLVVVPSVFLMSMLFKAYRDRRRRRGLPFPPGPRPLPVVGNLFDIPLEYSWKAYAEWSKTYGNHIISLTVLGKVIVVLNSHKPARDLIDKRSAMYSARPHVPFHDLTGWGWIVPVAPYDDAWRAKRRILDHGMRPNAAIHYQPMQKAKTHDFLKSLASGPEKFREHINHFQGAIIMSSVYGYDVSEHGDKYLGAANEMNDLGVRTMLPGALFVNDLPILKYLPEWLPGMGFKELARQGRRLADEVRYAPFEFVKNGMHTGTARPSITLANLEQIEDIDSPESARALELIAEASGSLYSAGADTTVSTLASFFLMLAQYPDTQKKAQAELDAVTGRERLPDYSDRPRLPYIDAICKELLRWNVVTPIALPHAAMQDDEYNGYFIPRGATVIANTWQVSRTVHRIHLTLDFRAILHDPTVYPDPETFRPERFLTEDGNVKDDPTLSAAFGFGKRVCPGRHLVDMTLFIFVTSVLSVFTVAKAKDAQGHEIPVDCVLSTSTLISYPEPFKCSITPRDSNAQRLIGGL